MNNKGIWGIVICVLWTLTGCRKEISEQLQGKWQLKTVEQSGRVTNVDTVWYNFQSESLFMYQVYRAESDVFIHQYGYKTESDANTIRLELTSYPRPVDDFLSVTDWEERAHTFTVEKINAQQLILRRDDKTYCFIKF
ncbi:MAG: lipocalin-like domain-containing protein [Tannerella sp.]|jgi:hypothetical protein|nr:lipocalin-like domain-containing protein [Tannerella sp.]